MEYDLIGITGGGLGALVMEVFPYLSRQFGVPSLTYTQMNMWMFFEKVNASNSYFWLTGFLGHLVAGAVTGCIFVHYYLRLSKQNFLVVKAVLWGVGLWLLTYGFLGHVIVKVPCRDNGLVPLIALLDHSIYGLILGIFIHRYRNKGVSQKKENF